MCSRSSGLLTTAADPCSCVCAVCRREAKLGHTAELNGALAADNIVRSVRAAIKGGPTPPALATYPEGAVGAPVSPRIYCLSLGPDDATLGFNGLVVHGLLAALAKWTLEWTKVAAARGMPVGECFWWVADVVSCWLSRSVLAE